MLPFMNEVLVQECGLARAARPHQNVNLASGHQSVNDVLLCHVDWFFPVCSLKQLLVLSARNLDFAKAGDQFFAISVTLRPVLCDIRYIALG